MKSSKKLTYLFFLLTLVVVFSSQGNINPSVAAQFFTVSGKVTLVDGSPVKALRAEIFFRDSKVANIDGNGSYSFLVQESNFMSELTISLNNYPSPGPRNYLIPNVVGMANFTTKIQTNQDLIVNLSLPPVISLAFEITDGKSQPLSNSALRILSSGGKFKSNGGLDWIGIVYPTGDDLVTSINGQYTIWIYALPNYTQGQYSFNYSQMSVNLNSSTHRIPLDKSGTYKLCAPINLGLGNSTPSDCYDEFKSQTNFTSADAKAAAELKAKQEAEAKAATELKAKQEAEAKAAAELKAKQEAEAKLAASKKSTITCIKGKLTKKVTAAKPKCPSGYKLKK